MLLCRKVGGPPLDWAFYGKIRDGTEVMVILGFVKSTCLIHLIWWILQTLCHYCKQSEWIGFPWIHIGCYRHTTIKSIPIFSIWSRARTWWLLLLSCCWVAKTPLSKIILHLPKYWMNINVENVKNHCCFIVNGFQKKKCGQNASSRFIAMRWTNPNGCTTVRESIKLSTHYYLKKIPTSLATPMPTGAIISRCCIFPSPRHILYVVLSQ